MNVVVLHFPPVFSELLYNSLLNRITEYNNKACICLAKQSIFQADQLRLRGAIIKKTEKRGNFFSQKSPNFNFGTSKIQGWGLNFSKMSQSQLLPSSASTQLNSTSTSTEAEFSLNSNFSSHPATHPATHPASHPEKYFLSAISQLLLTRF